MKEPEPLYWMISSAPLLFFNFEMRSDWGAKWPRLGLNFWSSGLSLPGSSDYRLIKPFPVLISFNGSSRNVCRMEEWGSDTTVWLGESPRSTCKIRMEEIDFSNVNDRCELAVSLLRTDDKGLQCAALAGGGGDRATFLAVGAVSSTSYLFFLSPRLEVCHPPLWQVISRLQRKKTEHSTADF